MFSVLSLLLGSLLFKTILSALPFHELVLQMPAREDASNNEEEHCLCISVLLDPNKRYHIVSFAPIGVHENVNHMALVSGVGFPSFCKEDKEKASNSKHGNGLKSGNEIWDLEGWQCSMGGGRAGETWQALDSRTLYIWGQRAGGRGLVLPRDTALSVGGREDERLVLQVFTVSHKLSLINGCWSSGALQRGPGWWWRCWCASPIHGGATWLWGGHSLLPCGRACPAIQVVSMW